MNRDPFLRLALIVAASLWATGAFVVLHFLGLPAASAYIAAPLYAAALTYEASPKKPEPDRRRRQRQPAEGTRGFERIE